MAAVLISRRVLQLRQLVRGAYRRDKVNEDERVCRKVAVETKSIR